jgi:hypothetical protein
MKIVEVLVTIATSQTVDMVAMLVTLVTTKTTEIVEEQVTIATSEKNRDGSSARD